MVLKSFIKTRPGQRIDQPDFEHVADRTPRDGLEQLGQGLLTGTDTNRHYVLSGFTPSVNSTTVTVAGGTALLSYRDQGELRYSTLVTDGATSRSIDIGSFPDATYFVYVAVTLEEGTYENRAFWDTTLNPDAETTRTVATKRIEDWTIAVETVSPGDEWMKIAQVVKSAGSLTLTDQREFYFEGSPVSSPAYSVTTTEWGTNDDRNANRATYGVKSLRKFVRAVQHQLTSIIGGTGWWSAIPAGADLTTLLSSKLARDGSQTMQGNLLPDGNSTRNLGSGAANWLYLYATNIETSLAKAYNRFRASGDNGTLTGGGRSAMLDGVMTGTTPNNEYRTLYQNENSALPSSSGPTVELAINAEWYYDLTPTAGNYWRSSATGQPSFLYSFGRDGLRIYRRAATGSRWADNAWTLLYSASSTALTSNVDLTLNGNLNGTFNLTGSGSATKLTVTAFEVPAALHTIYSKNIVHARGTVDFNTATLASGIDAHFNFGAVNIVGAPTNEVTVNFDTDFAVGNTYQVSIGAQAANQYPVITEKNIAYFKFKVYDLANGILDPTTLTSKIDFIVVGG